MAFNATMPTRALIPSPIRNNRKLVKAKRIATGRCGRGQVSINSRASEVKARRERPPTALVSAIDVSINIERRLYRARRSLRNRRIITRVPARIHRPRPKTLARLPRSFDRSKLSRGMHRLLPYRAAGRRFTTFTRTASFISEQRRSRFRFSLFYPAALNTAPLLRVSVAPRQLREPVAIHTRLDRERDKSLSR